MYDIERRANIMSQNIMNKPIVLQLNGNWMPVGIKSIKEAFIAMTSEGDAPAALALDIAYELVDGECDFSNPTYMNAVGWEDWIQLPIRDYDFVVRSARLEVRAPTVLIAPNYREMPMRKPSPTKNNIFERDGGVCQYTGKKLGKGQGNIDHVVARARGGKNEWNNMVWCDKSLNSKKGDRLPHEVGLKLIRKPVEPPVLPLSMTFNEAKHPTWIPFITKSKGSN